jgi:hypothetical protein
MEGCHLHTCNKKPLNMKTYVILQESHMSGEKVIIALLHKKLRHLKLIYAVRFDKYRIRWKVSFNHCFPASNSSGAIRCADCRCLGPDRAHGVTPRSAFGQDGVADCSSMVLAKRTRDGRQFFTGLGRMERRNTLLSGVDLYMVGVTPGFRGTKTRART